MKGSTSSPFFGRILAAKDSFKKILSQVAFALLIPSSSKLKRQESACDSPLEEKHTHKQDGFLKSQQNRNTHATASLRLFLVCLFVAVRVNISNVNSIQKRDDPAISGTPVDTWVCMIILLYYYYGERG